MNTSSLSRLMSFAMAACVTLSVLAGIDALAVVDTPAPAARQMATQEAPAAAVSCGDARQV